MARTINLIHVSPMDSREACQSVAAFGATLDGDLIRGVELTMDLSTLPLRWHLRIDRSCDAFDVILSQLRDDPRVTLQ